MPEIIDLTLSSPPQPIEILSEGEIPASLGTSSSQRKTRRLRNRRESRDPTCDSVDSSRNQSLERRNDQDSRIRTSFQRRSASPNRRSPVQVVPDQELFFFDAAPAPAVDTVESTEIQTEDVISATDRLLLPSHVLVFSVGEGATPIEIVPPPVVDSEDDYIEYLDYEDRKAPGLIRYFEVEEETTQSNPTRFVCKNCGAEGDHKTYECPIQVCLTCGARDEHSTRSCPISKTCFTCGMKGHVTKTCPNRFSRSRLIADTDHDCQRCGSQKHKLNECPTLWRIYQYVSDEDRIIIMQNRKEKKKLSLGNGGEAYIGSEEWCYNCGNPGHLGDECDEVSHIFDIPSEPSAFSLHNVTTGPFYDPASEPIRIHRGPQELQDETDKRMIQDDWGMNAPLHVGKQGKNKDREKLAKKFRDQETDDTGDWFSNPRNMRNRGNDKPPPNGPKVMKFGGSMQDVGRHFEPPPPTSSRKNGPPSLLDRLGDNPHLDHRRRTDDHHGPLSRERESYRIRGASKNSRDQGDSKFSHSNSGRERNRQRQNSREWDREQRPGGYGRSNGPRYKGGYSR